MKIYENLIDQTLYIERALKVENYHELFTIYNLHYLQLLK